MKIEEGKYYRMRCGGAIRIDEVNEVSLEAWYVGVDDNVGWMSKNGRYLDDAINHPFDLIAEITEQEYNRIVSGKESDAILDMAQNAVMQSHYEVEELKRHNANLHRNLEAWESDYATLKAENERIKCEYTNYIHTSSSLDSNIREERRFEAAKAAMQGILASYEMVASIVTRMNKTVAQESVFQADALLKALEETK